MNHFGHLQTRTFLFFLCVSLAAAVLPGSVSAQESDAWRAELALTLLPDSARPHATVLLRSREHDDRYRDGTGPFICVSDASSPQRLSMVCHHQVLEEALRFARDLRQETELRGNAFRKLLCEEVASRGLEVPDGAMEITASLTRNEDGTRPSEMTVYHLLWLPQQTTETLGVVDEDPGDGQPWLHHAGMCGAHVMWSDVIAVQSEEGSG